MFHCQIQELSREPFLWYLCNPNLHVLEAHTQGPGSRRGSRAPRSGGQLQTSFRDRSQVLGLRAARMQASQESPRRPYEGAAASPRWRSHHLSAPSVEAGDPSPCPPSSSTSQSSSAANQVAHAVADRPITLCGHPKAKPQGSGGSARQNPP